jgi:plastocyanin
MTLFKLGGGIALLSLSCAALLLAGDNPAGKQAGDTVVINIDDEMQYIKQGEKKQNPVVVKVGQTVVWQNKDELDEHTATHKVEKGGKPLFDTGKIPPGKSAKVVFDQKLYDSAGGKPGGEVKLDYICTLHKEGKAVIVLKAADAKK